MKIVRPVLLALTVLAGTLVGGDPVRATPARLYGNDVSWPQCPESDGVGYGLPMPGRSSRFVVIGLTQGRGFVRNPCLTWQVEHAKRRKMYTAAYAFTTYPTPAQFRTYRGKGRTWVAQLRNVGAAQARFNVTTMRRAGLRSRIVWIDVEPTRKPPWSGHKVYNAAVVDGTVRGYRRAGVKVGVYSTRYLWHSIVGNVRYGLPEWRTVGGDGQRSALARCARGSIQGGKAVIAQWWTSRVDYGLTCPGFGGRVVLKKYFRKY